MWELSAEESGEGVKQGPFNCNYRLVVDIVSLRVTSVVIVSQENGQGN